MIEARKVSEFEAWRKETLSADGLEKTIGFVPTMGALHSGHRSLLQAAREKCDLVVSSLFLNPTQFNNQEDLSAYPVSLEEDIQACREDGVDCLFIPEKEDLYPDHYRFRLTENVESRRLEGAHRPGHFDGVLTVVLKLFNIVRPDDAWFGEKDWQQLRLIEDMVSALFLPIQIHRGCTIREDDGLAMSSRNRRLTKEARVLAPEFYRALQSSGATSEVETILSDQGFEVEYIEEVDNRRLGAVLIDGIRLIDNIPLSIVHGKVQS